MCNYGGGDVDDWYDDSDTDDHVEDTGDDGHHEQGARNSDLDLDDEDRTFLFPDTWGVAPTRKEKDIQGIQWERLAITRERYR
uniref:Uncharacterized protein n=1 Tax=Aegilops tauschii subsp. strangulata TaxID=200361 RepID=A0A453PFN7_AEGTS